MCELFGMTSRVPTGVTFSLGEFARHGGQTGPHRDGWGVAWFDAGDVRLMREPGRASDSPGVAFAEQQHVQSDLVVAHLRLATTGGIALRNTQPFVRELGGRMHAFAHNGQVDPVFTDPALPLGHFRPIGDTDSERAFCALLHRLTPLWDGADGIPPLEGRLEIFATVAGHLAGHGPANLLYADGDTLFVASDQRRSWPWEPIRPPGLHVLTRRCHADDEAVPMAGLHIADPDCPQQVTLVASVPLTEEDWRPLPRGAVLALQHGRVVAERALPASPASPA